MSSAIVTSDAIIHVDIDNIETWQCPYFRWRDIAMITAINNSETRTPSTDTYHHGDLRRTVIQAALELAAEENDWDFSLREVARRAGVSHNAPYNHFPHKRDLVAAAAAAGHDLLRSELTAAVAKIADPRATLSKMGSAYVSFGIKNPTLYRLMFVVAASGPDWRPEKVLAGWVAGRTVLENILRRGTRLAQRTNTPRGSCFSRYSTVPAGYVAVNPTVLKCESLDAPRDRRISGHEPRNRHTHAERIQNQKSRHLPGLHAHDRKSCGAREHRRNVSEPFGNGGSHEGSRRNDPGTGLCNPRRLFFVVNIRASTACQPKAIAHGLQPSKSTAVTQHSVPLVPPVDENENL